jgi:hypothetical protein
MRACAFHDFSANLYFFASILVISAEWNFSLNLSKLLPNGQSNQLAPPSFNGIPAHFFPTYRLV